MRKTKTISCLIIIMAAIVAGSGCLTATDGYSGQKAEPVFSGQVIDADEAKSFSINATIMEIHAVASPPNIMVAERIIVIDPHKYENKIITPRLVDRDGRLIGIQDFKKGDRVVVRGLELEDETIFAESIVVQPKE
ncbi:hypothetical protein [uncultured Desulfosarcina sp.]|uniref:hypothetical protein n=1 Tax=uncultured Desulfosarcina sp. TaxID=218289 RepID=UPI0029C9097D|nr:hypothetical protein [uncultured Desulfosarcina sp.]